MKAVILIEDDSDVAETISGLLDIMGITCVKFSEASKAIQCIAECQPPLILVDIMMPGQLNGLDVICKVKKDERLKKIPVIAMSGYDSDQLRSKVLFAGADDYIGKPFDISALQKKIKNLLDPVRSNG